VVLKFLAVGPSTFNVGATPFKRARVVFIEREIMQEIAEPNNHNITK
jgi:hypothetical protein